MRNHRLWTIAVGLLSLHNYGCGQDFATGIDRPDNLFLGPFSYELNSGKSVPAEFGRLWLPGSSRSSRASLAFVRLRATSENPGPPIVYLAGGPGGSGIATGRGDRAAYFQALRELGDVILLDQRGTGSSTPHVGCDGNFAVRLDWALTRAEHAAELIRQVRDCAEAVVARGTELDDYTAAAAARDLEELRLALGADQLVLIGYSYGTHLALAYLREFEERVARVVLHGVEGPDHTLKLPSSTQRALERLDSLVRSSQTLAPRLPDFLDSVEVLLQRLTARPETSIVAGMPVVFGAFDAEVLLASQLGDRADIEELPAVILTVLQFGWGPVAPAVIELRQRSMLSALSYAADCASGASAARQMQIATEATTTLLGDAINFPYPEICAAWPVADLGDDFRSPIVTTVPTLFVSGSLDGRTPPTNATKVAAGFANGRLLLVENAGHNELATSPTVFGPIIRFLRGETDIPLTVSLPPLQFVVP